jgi:sugar lactone lactonase YvrE
MKMGPDGLLYGCQGAKKQVISIDPKTGTVKTVASEVTPNCLAIVDTWLYITETKEQQITRIDRTTGEKQVVDRGIEGPNGIARSNDGGTLAVSEYNSNNVWMFRIKPDGTLDAKMPSMTLRSPVDQQGQFEFNVPPPYKKAASGDGMCVDRANRYYVTSALGVQVFDPTGRLCGVMSKPNASKPLTSCIVGGPDFDCLYVTNGDAVYRRELMIQTEP